MSHGTLASLGSSLYRPLCLLVALLTFAGLANSQANPGMPAWSAYDRHVVDSVNLQNLTVIVNIPAMSKPGIFPISASLTGSFGLWASGSNTFPPEEALWNWPYGLNTAVSNALGYGSTPAGFTTISYLVPCPGGGTTDKYSGWYVQLPDGTIHSLPSTDYADSAGCLAGSGFTDQVIDGSGYTLSENATGTTSSVYASSGMSITGTSLTDSNGNSISWNTSTGVFKDTLGLSALTVGNPLNGSTSIQWNTLSGTASTTQTTTTYTLRSAFGCPAGDYSNQVQPVVTTVTLGDGTTVGLSYEATPGYPSDITGRLAGITLPTGGVVTYTYPGNSGNNYGLKCTYIVPTEITRTTSDGTTSYSIAWQTSGGSCSASAACSTTTVIDPGGNKKVYTFSAGWGAASPAILALTEVQTYQNMGTI